MSINPSNVPSGVVLDAPRLPCSQDKAGGAFPFVIERILVPIDFSELSRKALGYAVALARSTGARLILLHVVRRERRKSATRMIASPQFEQGKWQQLDESERQLVELRRREIGREPESEAIVQLGNPWREIVHAAKTWHVDLILMATHGTRRLHRILKPSTAERVVRSAPCPVLVVDGQGRGPQLDDAKHV